MKILAMLAMASMAWAQDAQPKMVHKLIQLKYVDANAVRSVLGALPGSIQADDRLHVLVVNLPPDVVAMVESAVAKLDVPPLDFDLTVYLISSAPHDNLPPALESTMKQLHGVFSYSGYQMLEDFVIRGRDGQQGSASGTFHGTRSTYSFRYQQASVSGDAPHTIRLRDLNLMLRYPSGGVNIKDGQPNMQTTGLETDIDIREGQKVVVGKSDLNNGDSPLILVVTAKVVE